MPRELSSSGQLNRELDLERVEPSGEGVSAGFVDVAREVLGIALLLRAFDVASSAAALLLALRMLNGVMGEYDSCADAGLLGGVEAARVILGRSLISTLLCPDLRP